MASSVAVPEASRTTSAATIAVRAWPSRSRGRGSSAGDSESRLSSACRHAALAAGITACRPGISPAPFAAAARKGAPSREISPRRDPGSSASTGGRKSGGKGKRVVVLVGPGGRGTIKKKKQQKQEEN